MSANMTCAKVLMALARVIIVIRRVSMGLLLDRSGLGFKQCSFYLVARVLQDGVFRVFSRLLLSQYAVLAFSLSRSG